MRFGPDVASADATPAGLSPAGDAFTVTLQQPGALIPPPDRGRRV